MTKLKVVVLLAVVALLLFPAMAFAETPPEIPCRFYGTVTVDGKDVADGTTIEAIIGGTVVATTATTTNASGDSVYGVKVLQPTGSSYEGSTVTFKIGAKSAEQTGTWVRGMNFETNLTSGIPVVGPDGGGITSVDVVFIASGETRDPEYNASTGQLIIYIPEATDGADGAPGAKGDPGEDAAGGIALPVVALVIAIIAAGMAAMGMRRKV